MPRATAKRNPTRKGKIPVKANMSRPAPSDVIIRAQPAWTTNDGKFMAIKAVFPEGLTRSLTCKTLTYIKTHVEERIRLVSSRPATTEAAYALVPSKYVITNGNEFGEIAP